MKIKRRKTIVNLEQIVYHIFLMVTRKYFFLALSQIIRASYAGYRILTNKKEHIPSSHDKLSRV